MFWFKKKEKNALDKLLDELQMNLENNYKDAAHKAFKDALSLFDSMSKDGSLTEKEVELNKKKLEDYQKKLEGYGHNIPVGW